MPATLHNARGKSQLLLTCEHASPSIPRSFRNLGLDLEQLQDHIGWDIGAGLLTQELGVLLDATSVVSNVSRLVVDCNRQVTDHDLIPEESHGIRIPGNISLSKAERNDRLNAFYHPYHEAIDRTVEGRGVSFLVSVHSFTPSLAGVSREFDVGVLFDDFEDLANRLALRLGDTGFSVRMNEPYSGLDGLIFSASHHGRRNDIPYLEIEINNRLLRNPDTIRMIAKRVAASLEAILPR
jgi:predicted N-formylglutamate amidohydrolase